MRYDRVLILIAFCAGAYALYSYVFPTLDVRYRLNVEVMAGGKLYSTSSVVDASVEQKSYFSLVPGLLVSMNGPCPSIDLGPSGILFIVDDYPRLIRPKSLHENRPSLYPNAERLVFLPFQVYPVEPKGMYYATLILDHKSVSGTLEGEVAVPLDRLPMIVRFRDIDDPSSLEELDPSDLSAAYGPGSRVIRATLAMTNDRTPLIPSYWPAWISTAKSQMGLDVAVPYKGPNGTIEKVKGYTNVSSFKGITQ